MMQTMKKSIIMNHVLLREAIRTHDDICAEHWDKIDSGTEEITGDVYRDCFG